MTWAAGFAAITAVLWARSGLEAQVVAPDSTACFDVELGEWQGSVEWFDSLVYSVPPRILLDPRPDVTSNPDDPEHRVTRRLGVPEGALPTSHRRVGWNRLSADSARMFWGNGHVGVWARVAWMENGFAGSARTFTDVPTQPFLTAPINGTAVDCDAPLVYRLEDQRPLIRSLPLEGGDSLALRATSWDESVWSETRPHSYEGTPRLAPPFDGLVGASLTLAALDETVGRIGVSFGSAPDYERLKTHLVEVYGEPTNVRGADEYVFEVLTWENRTTAVTLYHSKEGPERPSIVALILRDPRTYH